MEMQMPTDNQINLCKAIFANDYNAFNGRPPSGVEFVQSNFQVWSDCLDCTSERVNLPSGKALSGLVSSAVQAGLVGSDGEAVWLTRAGFDVASGAASQVQA
jgi:hypothetical protein